MAGDAKGWPRRWRSGNLGRLLLVTTGDLDRDGRAELIAAAGRDLKIYDFRLGTYMLVAAETMTQDVLSLTVADLDGDGHLEICAGTRDNIHVFGGRGRRMDLLCQSMLYPGAYFRRLTAADLDGDGRAELVGAASGAQTLYLFKLDVDEAGQPALVEEGRTYLGGLAWAELGADGEDVVAATTDGYVDVFIPGVAPQRRDARARHSASTRSSSIRTSRRDSMSGRPAT